MRARQNQRLISYRLLTRMNKDRKNIYFIRRPFSSIKESIVSANETSSTNEAHVENLEISILSQKERIKQDNIRAHKIRQQNQQQIKQERTQNRQKDHLKLTLVHKLQSTLSTQKRRRSEAAKALGPLFRVSATCYQDTMAALDLNTFLPNSNKTKTLAIKDLNGKKKTRNARRKYSIGYESDDTAVMQHNSGLNSQYRKLYMRSINSFIHCLQTTPSSLFPILADDEGKLQKSISALLKHPDELDKALVNLQDYETMLSSTAVPLTMTEALLQDLVECGFHNGKFAKQYRNNKVHELANARIQMRIKLKAQELERRISRLTTSQITLDQASTEFRERKLQQQKERESKKEEGLLQSLMNNFTNFFSSSQNNNPSYPTDEFGRRLSLGAMRRKEHKEAVTNLKTLDSKVREAKRLVRATKNAILRLETEIEYPSLSFHKKKFQEADEVMSKVLKDLCPAFAKHIKERHATLVETYRELDGMTDLTKPHEWYPKARKMKRKIIFHGGATNSGKTYNALQRLKEVKKGLYVGPLRLLAAEVYENLTASGIATNLYTGKIIFVSYVAFIHINSVILKISII